MKTVVRDFNELIEYLERPEIEFKQIAEICTPALSVIFVSNYTKSEAIEILKEYWREYGHLRERPLFID